MLFGGQILAQALRAAARTVDPDRYPHSLHGYFLRPGSAERPVLLQVWRDATATASRPAGWRRSRTARSSSTCRRRSTAASRGWSIIGDLPQGAPHYDEVEEVD